MNHNESIPPSRLLLALVAPLLTVVLSSVLKLQLERKLLMSIIRSALQLFLAGYVLLGFIFSMKSPIFVFMYILIMVLISAQEATTRLDWTYRGHFRDTLLTIIFGSISVGIYGALVIYNPEPWFAPNVLVPTIGMIIGNSISGPCLALNKLIANVYESRHEVEIRLSFGATKYESIINLVRDCFSVALIANLNQMSVVGIVAIPGMMAGSLLAGASTIVAAEFQMTILWLSCSSRAFTTGLSIWFIVKNAVFNSCHQLTLSNLWENKFKLGLDSPITERALFIKGCFEWVFVKVGSVWKYLFGLCSRTGRYYRINSTSLVELKKNENDNFELLELSTMSSESSHKASYQIVHCKPCKSDIIILNVLKLNIRFENGTLLFPALEPLNISISRGERIVLEGCSGLGKTRLLRAIAKLEDSFAGKLYYQFDSDTHNPTWRKNIIYVPQSVPVMIGSPMTLLQECLLFRTRQSKGELSVLMEHSCRLEQALLLATNKMKEPWSFLSGGERQRCLIAIAIILAIENIGNLPSECNRVLLLDEPTAACDDKTTLAVEKTLIDFGITCIMVTHDKLQANRFAHKRIVMNATSLEP